MWKIPCFAVARTEKFQRNKAGIRMIRRSCKLRDQPLKQVWAFQGEQNNKRCLEIDLSQLSVIAVRAKRTKRNMNKSKRSIKPAKDDKPQLGWRGLMKVFSGAHRLKLKSKQLNYENTYRLDPIRKFNPSRAETVLRNILEKHFNERSYNPRNQTKLTTTMTDEIKYRMKALNYPRYRYVVHITVGQKQDQGLRIASRCVWDEDRDTFASVTFESAKDIFAVATVYAVYFE